MTFDPTHNLLDIPIEQSYKSTAIKIKVGRITYNVSNKIALEDAFQENALSNMISAKYIYANKKVFLEVTPIEGFSLAQNIAQNIVFCNTRNCGDPYAIHHTKDVPDSIDTATYAIVEGSLRAHVHKHNESYSYTVGGSETLTRQYDIHTESWLVTGLTLEKVGSGETKTYDSFYVIGSKTRFTAGGKQIVTIADELPPIPRVTFTRDNGHTRMILTFQSAVAPFWNGAFGSSPGGFRPLTQQNYTMILTHSGNTRMPTNQIIVNPQLGLIPLNATWTIDYDLARGSVKFVDSDGNPVDGKLPMPTQTFEITHEKVYPSLYIYSTRSEIQFSRPARVTK